MAKKIGKGFLVLGERFWPCGAVLLLLACCRFCSATAGSLGLLQCYCWPVAAFAVLLLGAWDCCSATAGNCSAADVGAVYCSAAGSLDPYILCWDIRNTADIVYKLYRSTEYTNQRIFFDIETCGRHLGTGGQDGQVHIYDLQTGQWISSFQAASDTVNGFCFHPSLPMAASSSGHRRFGVLDNSDENMSLRGEENCVSVWGFAFASMEMDATNVAYEDTYTETKSEDVDDIQEDH